MLVVVDVAADVGAARRILARPVPTLLDEPTVMRMEILVDSGEGA